MTYHAELGDQEFLGHCIHIGGPADVITGSANGILSEMEDIRNGGRDSISNFAIIAEH